MKLFDKLLRWNELHTQLKVAKEAGIEIAKENGDLRVENAELREQVARLFDKTLELATKNAKLQELVEDMWLELEERTRELGIEVE